MALIKVDTAEVGSVASQLKSGADAMAQQLLTLRSQADTLNAIWTGDAANAFKDVYVVWDGASKRMQTALEALSNSLNAVAGDYEATENSAASRFK